MTVIEEKLGNNSSDDDEDCLRACFMMPLLADRLNSHFPKENPKETSDSIQMQNLKARNNSIWSNEFRVQENYVAL